MASTPVSDSQSSTRIPRPSRQRAQVFGYPLRRGWVLDFGRKHNVDPNNEKTRLSRVIDSVDAIRKELEKDGDYAVVRCFADVSPDVVAQVYVARNFSTPMKDATTKELLLGKVEKLKKFLGTNDEPQWMHI